MQSLLNPNSNPPISFLPIQPRSTSPHTRIPSLLPFTPNHHHCLQQPFHLNLKKSTVPFALGSPNLDLFEAHLQNPTTISTSFRNPNTPKPNQVVLDAQARVCTGPTQTKPLTEDQASKVLLTILSSVTGELKDEEVVSKSQLGAFFAGMTIRAKSFPEATQWSDGEKRAMKSLWPSLVQVLPPDVIFIADPDGSVMGEGYANGLQYVGNEVNEMRLVRVLREVLQGGHVGYEDVAGVLKNVLPLGEGYLEKASDSLVSAFLIGQRMNRETDAELQGYCLAFDDEFGDLWSL